MAGAPYKIIMPKQKLKTEDAATRLTKWIGTTESIWVHTSLFTVSFLFILAGVRADTVLLVLTTAVSLEAIYLAIFIQMTLNYTTEAVEDIGEDVEEMQEDIGELQEDVEDISEDVEEITEDESAEENRKVEQKQTLTIIQADLRRLMDDIAKLQQPKQ